MRRKCGVLPTTLELTYCLSGLLERYHITRHTLGFDSVVIVSAQYLSTDRKQDAPSLTKEILFPALEKVIHDNTPLAIRVSGVKSSDPIFVRLKSVNLSQVVRFLDAPASDDIDRVFEEEFINAFDDSDESAQTPLWRLTVTQDNHVIFAWHHAIGDGLSGIAVHQALLNSLNEPLTSAVNKRSTGESYVADIDPQATLIPALDSLTDLSVSLWTLLFKLIPSVLPPLPIRSTEHIWTGNPTPKMPSLVNYVKTIVLTPQRTKSLHELCKRNGTTLTAFLHELAIQVLIRLVQPESSTSQKPKRVTTIPYSIPLTLRRITNMSFTVLCDQTSAYAQRATYSIPDLTSMLVNPPSPDNFPWERATNLSKILRTAAPNSREVIGSLKYLSGKYEAFFLSKLGKKREQGIEVSNLGAFKLEPQSSGSHQARWTIGKTYFAQNDGVQGAAIKVNITGDPLGGMSFSITSGKDAVPDGLLDKFKQDLELCLSRF